LFFYPHSVSSYIYSLSLHDALPILQNLTLLIISLIFYAWGEPIFVALIIFSAGADYVFGLLIGTYRQRKKWKARLALYGSLFIRSEEHTSELQSRFDLVCRFLLHKK